MKIRKKNKKAQIGAALQELVGTILIALIIIILFAVSPLFGLPKFSPEEIKGNINEQIYNHYFIMSRLREQVTVSYDGKNHEINGTDLVKLGFIDENTEEILESQGLELLNKLNSFYVPFNLEKIYVTAKTK